MMSPDGTLSKPEAGAPAFPPLWKRLGRSPAFVSVLMALVTLAIFWPVAGNEFINYDDDVYITANPHVRSGLNARNVTWAFTASHEGNWHPLTWISHMLDCQLFGLRAGAHHLVNLGFHVANALLLFLGLRLLTGAHWRSALVAMLFALHPLRVESVAWAAERKDVLSGFCFMLALLLYARYALLSKVRGPRSKVCYGLALLAFALGLMSKPMLVTLPFVLLLLDYWPLQRLGPSEDGNRRAVLLEKLPFLALSIGASVITYLTQRAEGTVSTTFAPSDRIANALVSCVRYLGKMFWPANLSVFYPHPGHWPAGVVIACAVLLFVVSGAVFHEAGRRRYLAVGWLWFLGMLVPVIGLIQVGMQSMADRYTYLPMIGLSIMLVWGAGALVAPRTGRAAVAASAAIGCLAIGAWLCRLQLRHWQNSRTLFEHAVQVTARNAVAHINLGSYWFSQGRFEEAMTNYQHALAYKPADEDARYNLGLALFRLKRYEEAIACHESALRVWPERVRIHHDLAMALGEAGALDQAAEHYQFVLAREPGHAEAHNGLGTILARQGRQAEAAVQFRAALRCATNLPAAHLNLAQVLVAERQFDEAAQEYGEYLQLTPDDFLAQQSLADLLTRQGRLEEAVRRYTEAVKLEPDYPEAYCNLGLALARLGRLDEGAACCREALKLKPDFADAQNNLGIILGMQGRTGEAKACFREAIRLDPDHANAHSNLGNALIVEHRFDEAIREYQESRRINPDNPAIHLKLAGVLAAQGRREEAAGHYREALRLNPDNAEARQGLEKNLPRVEP